MFFCFTCILDKQYVIFVPTVSGMLYMILYTHIHTTMQAGGYWNIVANFHLCVLLPKPRTFHHPYHPYGIDSPTRVPSVQMLVQPPTPDARFNPEPLQQPHPTQPPCLGHCHPTQPPQGWQWVNLMPGFVVNFIQIHSIHSMGDEKFNSFNGWWKVEEGTKGGETLHACKWFLVLPIDATMVGSVCTGYLLGSIITRKYRRRNLRCCRRRYPLSIYVLVHIIL